MKYDVVIIGSGIGGLSTALSLAKAGKCVVVVEKHLLPGGYATNFKRKGTNGVVYEFDVSLHGIGALNEGSHVRQFLQQLGILDKIKPIRKKETATLLFKEKEIDIPDSFEAYKVLLHSLFPQEKEGIDRLFSYLHDFEHDMKQVYEKKKAPSYYNKLQSVTIEAFLRDYVDNDEFVEFFSFLWLYYGLPVNQLSALYYLLPWLSYHMGGTYYIEGGAQKLSNVFVEEIKAHGGEVLLREEVVSIDVEDGKVTHVMTKKGNEIKGDMFVFNGDPQHLFSLMPDQCEEAKEYRQRLGELEVGTSLSQLYIALDCHPSEIGIVKGDYFTFNHSSEENWKYIQEGDWNNVDFGITNYNELDPNLNKNGGVIVAVGGDIIDHWPERGTDAYKGKKAEVTEKLIERMSEYFPSIREHIVVAELGTPRTMKRYTNNSRGAVYGWEQSTTQSGYNRLYHTTTLENVFVAGSWSNPGGGYEGALFSGMSCAKVMLREKKQRTIKQAEEINVDIFMEGMVRNFNEKHSNKMDVLYQFIFDEKDMYFIQVKNKKATLGKGQQNDTPTVVIRTQYATWRNISLGVTSGEDALMDGRLKVEGEMNEFMKIPLLFGRKKDSKEESLFSAEYLIPITLIPWMIYWLFGTTISPQMMMLFAIVSILGIMFFVKPKGFKEVTILEGITLFAFTLYGAFPQWSEEASTFMMYGIVMGSFICSALLNKPITAQYAKWRYPSYVRDGKLFLRINKNLTYMWSIVFALQYVAITVIPSPFHFVAYVLPVVGGVISAVYPKWAMK